MTRLFVSSFLSLFALGCGDPGMVPPEFTLPDKGVELVNDPVTGWSVQAPLDVTLPYGTIDWTVGCHVTSAHPFLDSDLPSVQSAPKKLICPIEGTKGSRLPNERFVFSTTVTVTAWAGEFSTISKEARLTYAFTP